MFVQEKELRLVLPRSPRIHQAGAVAQNAKRVLRRIARRKHRVERSLVEARTQGEMSWHEQRIWFSTWFWAWPQVKTWATEEEVKARLFGQSWAEVWTRKEAKVWARAMKVWGGGEQAWARAQAQASAEGRAEALEMARHLAGLPSWERAEVRGEAVALAEALSLAGVWVWVRGEAHARGEKVPSGLADSATIRNILSNHNRYGVARDSSHHSSQEYASIIHFIAPITRLPLELLRQIFLIIIDEASGPPLVLMLICRHWYAIVTSIWASLNLGTRTPIDTVTKKLERNQWLLDIVVDTDSDRGDFTPSDGVFDAIFAAIEASSRWRSLVVESFPAQADLSADVVNRGLQRCPNVTMGRFTTFKVKCACEKSPLLDGLLRILGTSARELTTVEINSSNVVSFLAPAYPSIFHSVKVLSLNTPGIPNPVDLLPHLHQLEIFTASHISFPIYHNNVDLPFIHTLRHLSLRAVSIQWMSGRTFHFLEECNLVFPLHRHVLRTFNTTLPNCVHLRFQGNPFDILKGISAHKLNRLEVTCSDSFNGWGSQQLAQLSHHVLGERKLAPKILHIGIEASNKAWINALFFMSDLEELVIDSEKPSSLSVKVFQALVIPPVQASNIGATSNPIEGHGPLCPSLKRLGLKYRRWLRPSEQFNVIPAFVSIIRSRKRSNYALERFGLWMRSDQKDPLELIESSQTSIKGFRRLAKESGMKGDVLSYAVDAGSSEASGYSTPHSPDTEFRNKLLG